MRGFQVDLSDPLCPNFVLGDREKERQLKPFKRTLIVKLMGAALITIFSRRNFTRFGL